MAKLTADQHSALSVIPHYQVTLRKVLEIAPAEDLQDAILDREFSSPLVLALSEFEPFKVGPMASRRSERTSQALLEAIERLEGTLRELPLMFTRALQDGLAPPLSSRKG